MKHKTQFSKYFLSNCNLSSGPFYLPSMKLIRCRLQTFSKCMDIENVMGNVTGIFQYALLFAGKYSFPFGLALTATAFIAKPESRVIHLLSNFSTSFNLKDHIQLLVQSDIIKVAYGCTEKLKLNPVLVRLY